MVDTYRARRLVKLAPDVWRYPPDLVPEAHTWYRRESIEHSGLIEEAKDVDEAEFRAAVEQYCPDLAETIYSLTGLDGTELVGPHKTPRAAPAKKTAAKKAPAKAAAKAAEKTSDKDAD
jgi:hypothetical protein